MTHRILFSNEPDEYESDGVTLVNWREPTRAISSFPLRSNFTLGQITWYMELNVLPGRFGDRLQMYLMKLVDDTLVPMMDISINNGVQINVNDELRIYAYDVSPVFEDLYRLDTGDKLRGVYNIGVAIYS